MNEREREAQERETLRQELLEWSFGAHPEPERIESLLESDSRARALLEEVKQTAALLEEAARDQAPELALESIQGPSAASRRDSFRGPRTWSRLRLVAASLLGLSLLVPLANWGWRAWTLRTLEGDVLRLVVSGPPGMPDAAPARFRVETWDAAGTPRACEVRWALFDEEGAELSSHVKRSAGAFDLDIPASLRGARRLDVSARQGAMLRETSLPLAPGADSPLVHLTTDKPIYRPGEQAYLRAVLLDRLSLEARDGQYHFRITDPKGVEVSSFTLNAERGTVAQRWTVPVDSAGGHYNFEIRDGASKFSVESVPFQVLRFQPPALAKTIDLDRKTYAPGSKGAAEVRVERVEGGLPVGAALDASVIVDGAEVWRERYLLDEEGRAIASFEIPQEVERGEARFVARITDGGLVETAVEPFVVPTGELLVSFYPEGGELVAGVANRVYAEVQDPLGRAISARGRVVDSSGRALARFETEHQGRARFTLTPDVGAAYRLEFDEPQAAAVELPQVLEQGVVLRALSDTTPAGEALALELSTPHPGPWIVGSFCRGVLVGQDSFHGAGTRRLSLDLPSSIAGVLRVTVFDANLLPVAERLVQRASAHSIHVSFEPQETALAPGEHQSIALSARDESGRPVSATLGLVVSDRAVRELYGEARPGLSDQTWLCADLRELDELESFLGGDDESRRNIDLLLGTRGWRRFAWRDADSFLAEHGDDARRALIREGRPQVPAVSDSFGEDRGLIASAQRDLSQARELSQGVLVLGGLLLGLWVLGYGTWRVSGLFATGRTPQSTFARGLASALVVLAAGAGTWSLLARTEFAGGVPLAAYAFDQGQAPAPPEELARLEAQPHADQGQEFFFGEERKRIRFLRDLEPENEKDFVVLHAARIPDGAQLGEPLEEMPEIVLELGALLDADGDEMMDGFFANDRRAFNKAGFLVQVREYAHRHTPGPTRSDFTETVYWNGLLVTDDEGRASVEFDVSDRVTTWIVEADAHGAGRVGQARTSFESRIPLRLETVLPTEITRGDELLLPVAVIAEDPALESAQVSVEVAGPLALRAEGAAGPVALSGGRGRRLVSATVTEDGERATITLTGRAGPWSDRVEHQLSIAPRGFPHRLAQSGVVTDSVELVVPMPDDYVEGSLTAHIKLYPSPLSDLMDGLEGLLREPSGCFEQASSSNYPNVLALGYLEAAGADAPAFAAKARGLVERGYAKISGYECSERGYEWFGGDPGHEALSAYGLLEFHDMARVFDVDREMVARTRSWLLGRRDGKGGYQRNERALDTFGRAPQTVTDAYVTYALAVTGENPRDIEAELDRLEERGLESEDAYELALCAAALAASERDAAADGARERLKRMQAPDGSLKGSTTSITSSGARDLAVETTSFAILAWLHDEDDAANVNAAVEFLLGQRTGSGTFGATQATIAALKALTAQAEVSRKIANPGTLRVYVNDSLVHQESFGEGQRGALEVADLERELGQGENRLRIELSGDNEFPWAFNLAYTSDRPADDPEAPLEIRTRLAQREVAEGETVALELRLRNPVDEGPGDKGLPMAMAIVGLPAGLTIPTAVLDDLLEAGRFDLWEIRGREIVLYWRGFGPGESKEVSLDCIARIPGTSTGPASRAYLYYTPDAVRWSEPLSVKVTPAGN